MRLDDLEPSERAREIAGDEEDPRRIEAILREAKSIVRIRPPLVICETHDGFICASAGVDASNTTEPGTLILLPVDSDASAAALCATRSRERTGRELGVIVTDSFGRPWRQGTIDVAIGAAGVVVLQDLKGKRDPVGHELRSTVIAVGRRDRERGSAGLRASSTGSR